MVKRKLPPALREFGRLRNKAIKDGANHFYYTNSQGVRKKYVRVKDGSSGIVKFRTAGTKRRRKKK